MKEVISCHGDADGITSAVLYAKAKQSEGKEVEVYVSPEFGVLQKGTTVVLDMIPKEHFTGLVIDHHPLHPENPPYKLVYGNVPACLLTYQHVRGSLPSSEIWKVVVGLVGDGAPELTPTEVWKAFPILLERTCNLYTRGMETSVYDYPVWMMLSSGINALCKTKRTKEAYEILYRAVSPLELITNLTLKEAKEEYRKEVERWLKDGIYTTVGEIMVGIVDSEWTVEKDIATRLQEQTHKTVICINLRTRDASIRGVLGEYLQEVFSDKQVLDMGGHPAFKGAKLVGPLEEVYNRVRSLR